MCLGHLTDFTDVYHTYCLMQKHTPGMFLTDFHMQRYTGGIILWVGIFLTVTPAANKSILRIYDLCMILVLRFTPYIINIMVQHEGGTLLISTDLTINLSNYITLKLFSYQI